MPGAVAVGSSSLTLGIASAFVLNSLVAIIVYAEDKFRASGHLWRIPERRLHIWELLCGWPGAVVAQQMFDHKHGKPSFQAIFWVCVLVNAFAVYYVAKNSIGWGMDSKLGKIRAAVIEMLN